MQMRPLALLLVPCPLLLAVSCGSSREAEEPRITSATQDLPAGSEAWSYAPVNDDTRKFVNRLRGFFFDSDMIIRVAPDASSFEAHGDAEELLLLRRLVGVFDSGLMTPDHVSGVWEIKNRDARLMLNSARGRAEWRRSWIALAPSTDRIYASVPTNDAEAFSSLIEEMDQGR